jgi:uncharacterized membrane protein YfcA
MMTAMQSAAFPLVFSAGLLAGVMNAMAGGGAFVAFPALLACGLGPTAANATSNVATWVGQMASTRAFTQELAGQRAITGRLTIASLVGGVLGAVLLLVTPEREFLRIVPWLLLVATLLFAFGPKIAARLRRQDSAEPLTVGTWVVCAQLCVSIYGGYFGAGQGIITLALLTISGLTNIRRMNAIKSLLAACVNGVAVIPLAIAGLIAWPQAAIAGSGAIIGGVIGARLALSVPPTVVRKVVILIGAITTIVFFARYR